jgi:hypothetical protein
VRHIVSNELPRLGDASSAVIGRIVLWRIRVSAGSGRRAAQEVEAVTLCSPQ